MDQEWILTAAHCVVKRDPEDVVAGLTVRVGSAHASSGGQVASAIKVIWQQSRNFYDINL